MRRVQRRLGRVPNGDRQMVDILDAVLPDGLETVEAACTEALADGVVTCEVADLAPSLLQGASPADLPARTAIMTACVEALGLLGRSDEARRMAASFDLADARPLETPPGKGRSLAPHERRRP